LGVYGFGEVGWCEGFILREPVIGYCDLIGESGCAEDFGY
jgi:hypothetical protein